MLLLTTFLVGSCRTKIICTEVRTATIEALPLCDISFKFNRCRCRCFNLNNFSNVDDVACGEGFKSGNYDLEYCEGISGFYIEDWALEVKPKVKKLDRIKRDNCK